VQVVAQNTGSSQIPDQKYANKMPQVVNSSPEPHQFEIKRVPEETTSIPQSRHDGSDGPRIQVNAAPPAKEPATKEPATKVQATSHESIKRQVVNSAKVFLDYQVENAGQSGVAKVEVWITRDQSKTWQKLCEDVQRKSPVEVTFPGDGLYGVTLVASNGRGAGSSPPTANDAPDWWIEVDTTRPTAQITKLSSVTEEKKGVVLIHWTAQDKNLGDGPVELSYGSTPQGPWQTIAKGLKGDGNYRWLPPREVGSQAYIQLVVRDLAGNSCTVHTLVPVLIDDPDSPRAHIRGITTTGTQPTSGAVEPRPLPIVPKMP
jgi:hypothetical protein